MSVTGTPAPPTHQAPAAPAAHQPAPSRPAQPAPAAPAHQAPAEVPAQDRPAPAAAAPEPVPTPAPTPAPAQGWPTTPEPEPAPPAEQQAPAATGGPAPDQAPAATSGAASAESAAAPAAPEAPSGGLSLVEVRRLWPDIVDATKLRRRVTWIHLTQNAQVVAVDERTLTLGFANSGARDSFDGNGSAEIVRQAAIDVVGADWRIETIVDPGASPDAGPPAAPRPAPGGAEPTAPAQPPAPAAPADPVPPATPAAPATPVAADEPPPPWAVEPPADLGDEPEPPSAGQPTSRQPTTGQQTTGQAATGRASIEAARGAILQTRPSGLPVVEAGPDLSAADADAHPDDEVVEHDSVADAELLARELGARVIEEINHT